MEHKVKGFFMAFLTYFVLIDHSSSLCSPYPSLGVLSCQWQEPPLYFIFCVIQMSLKGCFLKASSPVDSAVKMPQKLEVVGLLGGSNVLEDALENCYCVFRSLLYLLLPPIMSNLCWTTWNRTRCFPSSEVCSNTANQPWTETSETMSPNKLFFL